MVLKVHCSFCGAHHSNRKLIIAKNDNTICNECVADCEEIMSKDKVNKVRVPIYEKSKECNNVYKLTGSIFQS